MLSSIRRRLSYANVVSTLALALAIGGGTAYAANTVFSSDIVDDEVKTADLADVAVTKQKIRDQAVSRPQIANSAVVRNKINNSAVDSGKVKNNSLTGDDIDESSLSLSGGGGIHLMGGHTTGFNNASPDFASITGDSIGGNDVQGSLTPNTAMTLKDFAVAVETTPVNTATFTVRLDNGTTAIACTITNPATLCTDPGPLAVPARSRLSIEIQKSDGQNLDVGWYALLE